jgi:O-antigen ligase
MSILRPTHREPKFSHATHIKSQPSEAAAWASYVLLSVSLAFAVLSRGGVDPRQWAWSALGLSLAGIILTVPGALPDQGQRTSKALSVIGALLFWMGFQLVPLPPTFVAWLSPLRYSAVMVARDAIAQPPGAWMALSVAPAATMERLLYVVPAMVVFFAARDLCCLWHRRAWIIVAPVMAVASLESLLGLVQFYMMRVDGSGTPPVTGTYVNRNHFSGLLELVFPLAMLAAVVAWRRGKATKPARPVSCALLTVGLLGMAACLLFAVVASLSRMGFVAILSAILLTAIILLGSKSWGTGRRWRWAIPAFVVLFVLVLLPTQELLDRFTETPVTGQLTEIMRINIWKDTIHMIGSYRWVGSGLGAYEHGFFRFKTVAPLNTVDFAHNDYLQIAAELGVTGAILAGVLAMIVFWRVLAVVRCLRDTENWELAVGLLVALLTMGLHGLVDFNLYIPANALVLAWLCGVADSTALCTPGTRSAFRKAQKRGRREALTASPGPLTGQS